MKYTVKTTPMGDGKILQLLDVEVNGVIQNIMREVLDTKEKEIREALIKLGWTPPDSLEKV